MLADSVSAGTPFEVAVTVTHGPGRQVTFPAVPPGAPETATLALGDAQALAVRRLPPSVRGSARVDSAVYRVVVFTADSARVGPVAVRVAEPGSVGTVSTGSALVPVRSVLRGEAEPYEPAPIGPVEAFPSAAPLWTALALLAALMAGGAVWGLRHTLRRPEARVVVGPYAAATARLDALDREAPAEGAAPETIETHVVAVRDALRGYLADRLGVPAREATSQEILDRLDADARVSDEATDAVRHALRPADLVAFARVRPAPDAVARLRAATRAAVDAVEGGVGDGEREMGNGQSSTAEADALPPGNAPSPQSPVPSP
ncbi:hypothetical protein [Rubrivirga sp.]|uniref:hypothetical protein n=1 Tax=Rubrivirga sp. TaxID=1885344 RepID=UPI003B52FE3F